MIKKQGFMKIALPLASIVFCGIPIFYFVYHYSYNWPLFDDVLIFEYYKKIFIDNNFNLMDFFIAEGPHPLGTHFILTSIIFKVFGFKFTAIIFINFILMYSASLLLAATVSRSLTRYVPQFIVWVFFPFAICHPFQTELLLQANCFGWYLATAGLLFNINIIERDRPYRNILLFISLFITTLSSTQGVVILAAASFHMFLRNGKRDYVLIILFVLLSFLDILWLKSAGDTIPLTVHGAISPHSGLVATIQHLAYSGFAIVKYLIQTFGTYFGQRNPEALTYLGLGTTAFILAVLAIIGRGFGKYAAYRVSIVLTISSICFLLMFSIGRYQLGIAWAAWEFHMASLITPLLGGFILISAQAIDHLNRQSDYRNIKLLILQTPALFVLASLVISLPDTLQRSEIAHSTRILAKSAVCMPEASSHFIETTNGAIGLRYLDFLKTLCPLSEEDKKNAILKFPKKFQAIIACDGEFAQPLHEIWEIYRTRLNLLRTFPLDHPDSPQNVLTWMRIALENGTEMGLSEATKKILKSKIEFLTSCQQKIDSPDFPVKK